MDGLWEEWRCWEALDWNFFTTADLKLSAKHFAPMEYLSELSSVFF